MSVFHKVWPADWLTFSTSETGVKEIPDADTDADKIPGQEGPTW